MIRYDDERLRRLAEDAGFEPWAWARDVVVAYRKRVQLIDGAVNERDLQALRSLDLKILESEKDAHYSVRLTDKCRLILMVRSEVGNTVAVILELVDIEKELSR